MVENATLAPLAERSSVMRSSLLFSLVAAASLGCSSTSSTTPASSESSSGAAAEAGPSVVVDAGVVDFKAVPSDFDCLKNTEWTTVGIARYKNELGHAAETLAVARSADGGTFPVGTIVQLVPSEAMVKRGKGFNAASHDWEFFSLSVTASGTTIKTRGGGDSVLNFLGSSCLGCHETAAPQWDFICGDKVDGGNTHGCDPLPIPGSELADMADPRCK